MNYEILVLLSMYFFHIVDDYYLQGWLASAKQKSWWEKNAPDELYKYDYIMALLCHGFSWSFMINLPIIIYSIITGYHWSSLLLIVNMIIHVIIDDQKANKKRINLIQDQCIHFIQIAVTWIIIFI